MRHLLSLCFVCIATMTVEAAPRVTVTLKDYQADWTSQLKLGVTHTHLGIDHSDAKTASVNRAKQLLRNGSAIQNTHIIGWGVGDIHPTPSTYNWWSLDQRVNLMRSIGGPMSMTLAVAPGWMKASGDTFNMSERVLPQHYQNYANLAVEVAKRYPDVRTFQIWNEFKGFWSSSLNNWDYVAYTNFYNTVYDALKAYDPTLEVGGLYLVVQGTGSGTLGKSGTDTYDPIGSKDRQVIEYWLNNKHGADFIAVDRAIVDFHDTNSYTTDDRMKLTPWYGHIGRQLGEMTDLPIWWSEYYGGGGIGTQTQAAMFASIYKHMAESSIDTALMWNPNGASGDGSIGLFSDVRQTNGGNPYPLYTVHQAINDYFGEGTVLYETQVSSIWIEALVSPEWVMLVNKSSSAREVDYHGNLYMLAGYEVRFIPNAIVIPEPALGILWLSSTVLLSRRFRVHTTLEENISR